MQLRSAEIHNGMDDLVYERKQREWTGRRDDNEDACQDTGAYVCPVRDELYGML